MMITLTIGLEGHGNILFTMPDYGLIIVIIHYVLQNVCLYAILRWPWPPTLKDVVTFCYSWLSKLEYMSKQMPTKIVCKIPWFNCIRTETLSLDLDVKAILFSLDDYVMYKKIKSRGVNGKSFKRCGELDIGSNWAWPKFCRICVETK